MHVYYIDLTGVTTKQALFQRLKSFLPLPPETGGNLDALHDVLTEYGAGWDVIIYNTKEVSDSLGAYFEHFQKMCDASVKETPGLRIRLYP